MLSKSSRTSSVDRVVFAGNDRRWGEHAAAVTQAGNLVFEVPRHHIADFASCKFEEWKPMLVLLFGGEDRMVRIHLPSSDGTSDLRLNSVL
jgi:hypothetical protein